MVALMGQLEYLRAIRDSRVTVRIHASNQGMVANWDSCLFQTQSDFFLMLSDDDELYTPEAIGQLVRPYTNDGASELGLVFGNVAFRTKQGIRYHSAMGPEKLYSAGELIIGFFRNEIPVLPSASLLRSADLKTAGGYSSYGARYAVDACAWIDSVCARGSALQVPQTVAYYLQHDSLSNASFDTANNDLDYVRSFTMRCLSKSGQQAQARDVDSAITSSWNRIALAHVYAKLRGRRDSTFTELVQESWALRKRLFTMSNLQFASSRGWFHARRRLRRPGPG